MQSSAARSLAKPLERRPAPRQRVLLAGKLANLDATETIDCTIRNLSVDGAMIETATPQPMPGVVHLMRVKDGVVWDVEVVWRRGSRVGLRLKDRHDLRSTTDRQLSALRAIWGQMALR